jgi:ABC-2 type transport system ATP-binding protein
LSEGQGSEGLEKYGVVQSVELPRAQIRCSRLQVPATLSKILDSYEIDDVAVEDPPLEEVISSLYESVAEN